MSIKASAKSRDFDYNQSMSKTIIRILLIILALILIWAVANAFSNINDNIRSALQPLQQTNRDLSTQVAELLHPTPTVLPDPVTIVHEVRSLARLETIQYSVEKVIAAEVNQGISGPLFGDKLLFVAHGVVIAGLDLEKLNPDDLTVKDNVLYVHLPQAEVFSATLDNQKSYVYDRETGILTHGEVNLETLARQAAEEEIRKAAIEDGILDLAQGNAETYLSRLFRALGYPEVIFIQSTP
jgi:hypothetical protein